jgi:hypothetical protein
MATARDKLIANWRHELHAAQDAIAIAPQQAWLARMKVRLYRFLLACYAKSPWTTTPRSPDQSESVVFDQPEAQFLHGKPAKSAGKIQAVLKSVASAQSPPKPGPIAVGAGEHSYILIASESKTCDTLKLYATLKREGLGVRHVVRDGRDVVEVAAPEFHRARWLMQCHAAAVAKPRPRRHSQWINPDVFGHIAAGLATAPLIGWFASMMATVARGQRDEVVAVVFLGVSAAWFVGLVAYQSVQRIVRERYSRQKVRRPAL